MKNNSNLLTIAQASEKYRLPCPGTVRKWIADCKLPAILLRGKLVFDEEDLVSSLAFQIYVMSVMLPHTWQDGPPHTWKEDGRRMKSYDVSLRLLGRKAGRAAA